MWLPPRSSRAPSEFTEVTEFVPKWALSNARVPAETAMVRLAANQGFALRWL